MLATDGCASNSGNPACCFSTATPGGPRGVAVAMFGLTYPVPQNMIMPNARPNGWQPQLPPRPSPYSHRLESVTQGSFREFCFILQSL